MADPSNDGFPLAEQAAELNGLSAVTDDGAAPKVQNNGSILHLCKRFGEIAAGLDVFEVNDQIVFFDHRRKRVEMTGRIFRSWIERHVYVVGGFDSRTGEAKKGSLNLSDAMDVMVSDDFRRGVRSISGEENVRLPVVRRNGDLELLPWGYDDETGVYTVPGGIEYATDWDVSQGKAWVKKWFGSMPFADERSESVMVAGLQYLYSKYLPGGLGLKPGLLFEANQQGSGKSILGKACCAIVLGYAPVGKKKSREELDKEIEAHVKCKSPVIFLDNLYGSLRSATLDQLITSKMITFRLMGGQTITTMRNDAPVIVTGNDLDKNEDAHRRYLQCMLFEPGNPNERKVPHLLDDDVMEDPEWRAEALAALWSMVRHWDAKGRPAGPTTLGSFEAFSHLMGGLVTACGYSDPMERPPEHDGVSPEQSDFRSFARGIFDAMVAEEQTTRLWGYEELAKIARALDLFGDKIGDSEHGRRATITRDKLTGEAVGYAADEGYLNATELQHWSEFLRGKIGQRPQVDEGKLIVFGDHVKEKRRSKLTIQVVDA